MPAGFGRNNNDDLLNLVYLLGRGSRGDKDLNYGRSSTGWWVLGGNVALPVKSGDFLSLLASRRRVRDTEQEDPPSHRNLKGREGDRGSRCQGSKSLQ